MSLTTDLHKARALSLRDVGLLAEAAAWLAVFAAVTRVTRFERVTDRLGLVPGESAGALTQEAGRIGWAVRAASARAPVRPTCLRQALAGMAMLRRRGFDATLTLGVAKGREASARIAAHAWLRCGDEILTGEGGHERFAPLTSFHSRR